MLLRIPLKNLKTMHQFITVILKGQHLLVLVVEALDLCLCKLGTFAEFTSSIVVVCPGLKHPATILSSIIILDPSPTRGSIKEGLEFLVY
jgi:hypothetical protein